MASLEITLVLENLRSIHNVGSVLRTCDGLGVENVIYIGTTPFPRLTNDPRLPFQADKQTTQLHKTALGAEKTIHGTYFPDTKSFLHSRRRTDILVSLEQTEQSKELSVAEFNADHIFLVVGNEVDGVSHEILNVSQTVLEIPMHGKKESLNVEVATAICIYQLLYM